MSRSKERVMMTAEVVACNEADLILGIKITTYHENVKHMPGLFLTMKLEQDEKQKDQFAL